MPHYTQPAAWRIGKLHFLPHFTAKFLADFLHHRIVASGIEQGFVEFAGDLLNHQVTAGRRIRVAGVIAFCNSAPHSEPCKTPGCQQLLFIPL